MVPAVPGEDVIRERLVDPEVCRAKFLREIEAYRAHEAEYQRRGWFLVRAEFPEVFILMGAPQLPTRAIQYGLLFDFSDYDLLAPSLRFVDPFTREPLDVNRVPPLLKKVVQPSSQREAGQDQPEEGAPAAPEKDGGAPAGALAGGAEQLQNLVQGHGAAPAFLCVAGTREYHAHPYHSNDPWLAHRGTGPGRLHHLLDIVWRHGIIALSGYEVQVNMVPYHDQRRIP